MNVNYEIKEYFFLKPGVAPSVLYLVERRLAILGAAMLMDIGTGIDTLHIKRGAHEVVFSGTEVNSALKDAIRFIGEYACDIYENASDDTLALELSYDFSWSAEDEGFSHMQSPFELCSLLDSMKDEELGQLSYTMWNKADGSEGMGALLCYGPSSKGNVLRGKAAYSEVKSLPAEAAWYSEDPLYFYGGDSPFSPEIAEACRNLSKAAGNPHPDEGDTFTINGQLCQSVPDLTLDGEEGEYYLNFISLPTPESTEAFAAAMREVLRLTGEESYEAELIDLNAKKPRMLRLTVTKDGNVRYEITEG